MKKVLLALALLNVAGMQALDDGGAMRMKSRSKVHSTLKIVAPHSQPGAESPVVITGVPFMKVPRAKKIGNKRIPFTYIATDSYQNKPMHILQTEPAPDENSVYLFVSKGAKIGTGFSINQSYTVKKNLGTFTVSKDMKLTQGNKVPKVPVNFNNYNSYNYVATPLKGGKALPLSLYFTNNNYSNGILSLKPYKYQHKPTPRVKVGTKFIVYQSYTINNTIGKQGFQVSRPLKKVAPGSYLETVEPFSGGGSKKNFYSYTAEIALNKDQVGNIMPGSYGQVALSISKQIPEGTIFTLFQTSRGGKKALNVYKVIKGKPVPFPRQHNNRHGSREIIGRMPAFQDQPTMTREPMQNKQQKELSPQ